MIRKPGFYWVKIKDDIGTKWERLTIGQYTEEGDWNLVRSDDHFYDEQLLILSGRLEEPHE